MALFGLIKKKLPGLRLVDIGAIIENSTFIEIKGSLTITARECLNK